MQPLVLAIEPDLRQAAIVKRIIREKVLADVAVVDSRDAALEAMRTTVPDVLLLSALLSPRDEDELIAHLRTRRDAEHLQTHTIPQLASTAGGESKPSKGLLSKMLRRKGAASTTSGCDPDLFAEEIRTYLERASQRKIEVRDNVHAEPVARVMTPAAKPAEPPPVAESPESSWASPFEWRPSRSTAAPASEPEVAPVAAAIAADEPAAFEPPPMEAFVEPRAFEPAFEPIPVHSLAVETHAVESSVVEPFAFEASVAEPLVAEPFAAEPFVAEPFIAEPFIAESLVAEPLAVEPLAVECLVVEPSVAEALVVEPPVVEPPAAVPDMPAIVIAPRPSVRYPLTMRTVKGWWFVEGKEDTQRTAGDSELRGILSSLSVPLKIAWVAYADGCHIRRVRLLEA